MKTNTTVRAAALPIAVMLAMSATFALAPDAYAEEDATEVCANAHREAQRERREHHLGRAREQLLVCGRAVCPSLIRRDCTDWLVSVDAATPTIVLDVRAGGGAPLPSATRAFVDGGPAIAVDGRALAVDPGEHVVRVEIPGRAPIERRFVALEGEHAARITVALGDAPAEGPPPPPTASSRPFPVVPVTLGAVGLVGLGLFAGFGLSGLSAKSDLDDARCSPRCSGAAVDGMWRDFTVADVSLAIGVSALVAAGLVYLLTPVPASTTTTATAAAR